jgi:hypothetical protein
LSPERGRGRKKGKLATIRKNNNIKNDNIKYALFKKKEEKKEKKKKKI